MPHFPYPYEVNWQLVTGNGFLRPICSLSKHSLSPSLTVPCSRSWQKKWYKVLCVQTTDTQREFFLISNFWDWTAILGWNFLRHFRYFGLDYQNPFWYCEFLDNVFHYSTIIFTKKPKPLYLYNSQILIWEWDLNLCRKEFEI